jgi:predicted dehydrogenase
LLAPIDQEVKQTSAPTLRPAPAPFLAATGHLRLALIGCGEIAVDNAAAIALAPNASLTVCHDLNRALATDLAREHGACVAGSVSAVLERRDVDAVVLCLPHHLHAPIAIQAAEAGKHVIVEKPMAVDLESAVRMVRAADQAGVALSVCFPQRYEPAAGIVRRWLREQAVGRFGGLEVRWFADKPPSYFHGGFSGRSPSTWRMRLDQAGGGVLLMNLSHEVELVRYLTGLKIEEVMAVTANLDRLAEVEDNVSVSVSYEGGAIGSFVASAAARGWRHESVRIWGTDGHVEVKPEARLYTLRALDGLPTGQWTSSSETPELPARATYFSRFASAVAMGHPPEVSARDGLAAQAFVEAAYRSAASGHSVRPADLLKRADMPAEEVL